MEVAMVKKGQTKRVWTPKRKAEIAPETYTAKRFRADFTDANPLSAFSATYSHEL